jgi:hypothetical protein
MVLHGIAYEGASFFFVHLYILPLGSVNDTSIAHY